MLAQTFMQFLAASTIPSGLAGADFSSLQIQTLNAPPGLGQAAAAFQVNASPPAVAVFIIYFAMNNYVVHVEVGGAQGKVTEDSALTYARLIASRFPPQ
ncbi:MAG: hypothetical protein M1118_14760 [Chloroflexi bacterium]|nr:hypothetical protein [Chloroflexota bacterium]